LGWLSSVRRRKSKRDDAVATTTATIKVAADVITDTVAAPIMETVGITGDVGSNNAATKVVASKVVRFSRDVVAVHAACNRIAARVVAACTAPVLMAARPTTVPPTVPLLKEISTATRLFSKTLFRPRPHQIARLSTSVTKPPRRELLLLRHLL
jgi:hypothetical protein